MAKPSSHPHISTFLLIFVMTMILAPSAYASDDIKDLVQIPFPKIKFDQTWITSHPEAKIPKELHGKTPLVLGHNAGNTQLLIDNKTLFEIPGIWQGDYSYYESVCQYSNCNLADHFFDSGTAGYDFSKEPDDILFDSCEGLSAALLTLDKFISSDAPDTYKEYLHRSFIRELERQKVLNRNQDVLGYSEAFEIASNALTFFNQNVLLIKNPEPDIMGRLKNFNADNQKFNTMISMLKGLINGETAPVEKEFIDSLLELSHGRYLFEIDRETYSIRKLKATPLLLDMAGRYLLETGDPGNAWELFDRMIDNHSLDDFCNIDSCDPYFSLPSGAKGLINQYLVSNEYTFVEKENQWIKSRDYESQIRILRKLLLDYGDETYSCGPDSCSFIREYANEEILNTLNAKQADELNRELPFFISNTNDEESSYKLLFRLIEKLIELDSTNMAAIHLEEILDQNKEDFTGPIYCVGEGLCSCELFRLEAYYKLIDIKSETAEPYGRNASLIKKLISDFSNEIDFYKSLPDIDMCEFGKFDEFLSDIKAEFYIK